MFRKRNQSTRKAGGKIECCPHCGVPLEGYKKDRPKRWHERTSVTLCVAAVLVLVGLGFIHIIVGVVSPLGMSFDIVLKERFGYRETLVNATRIQSMAYAEAVARYPLGIEVLVRRGYATARRGYERKVVDDFRRQMEQWHGQFQTANSMTPPPAPPLPGTLAGDYCDRARRYAEQGRYEQAIVYFSRTVELDPTLAAAYHGRGRVYAAIGQLALGIDDLTRAIEIAPDFAPFYGDRGLVYIDAGRDEQAIADFTAAIDLDPTRADIVFMRSVTYLAQGRYDDVRVDVNRIERMGLSVPDDFLDALARASQRQR